MIDHDRISELISGKSKPETVGEEIFLVSFMDAWLGDDLINTIEKFIHELEKENFEQAMYLVFGYAIGQKDKRDSEDEVLDLRKQNKIN